MQKIDFRSDTSTHPTKAMREAIYSAKLGDDMLSEDPTVNELEDLAAKLLGKEDALLVSSGTMGNLVSILSHSQRGDEIITSGGIIGTIDRVMEDDRIEVVIGENVKVQIIRSTITSLLKKEEVKK